MFLVSAVIFFVLCLLAYDKMLPKLSRNLYRRLKTQAASSICNKRRTLTPLYLLALSIHSNMTAAFALSMGVLLVSTFCIITMIVSKYMMPSLRVRLVNFVDIRKLFSILSPIHRHLHIAMVVVMVSIMVAGTMVFIRDADCICNDEEKMAKVQFQVLFTNINAAFMALIVLVIYTCININTRA
eukprot:gene10934-17048_t